MKTISSFLLLFSIFFMASGGIVHILGDIATKNPNLDDESLEMVSSMNYYSDLEAPFRFSENPTNYSLTGYETIPPEDKDNSESKGFIEVFSFLGDAFFILPTFAHMLIPFLPMAAFTWIITLLVAIAGYYFTIAVYNAWKARKV